MLIGRSEVRRAVAADLETLAAHVDHCLMAIDQLDHHFNPNGEHLERIRCEREENEEGIEYALKSLGERLLLYTELLALPNAQHRIQDWHRRWVKETRFGGARHWSTSEGDGQESPAFTELRPILDGILVLLRPEAPPQNPFDHKERERERLEYCLRALAKQCFERNVIPQREHDLLPVMHSHLSGVFPDYTSTLTISKPIASFKPDGGVPSLKSAIECKFVSEKKDLAVAVRGLTEDLSGYAGSDDWTHFYSVVYMTAPFAAEGQFQRALDMSGNAGDWTTIVVTGTR